MKPKKLSIPKSTAGYGFTGEWSDKTVGWFMPTHLHKYDKRGRASRPYKEIINTYMADGDRLFLCKITVEPVKDKLGRPITRVIKKNKI